MRVRMHDDASEHPQPDVLCDLRPGDARELAIDLLACAENAERTTCPPTRTMPVTELDRQPPENLTA